MLSNVYAESNSGQEVIEWLPAQLVHIGNKSYLAERSTVAFGKFDTCCGCGSSVGRGYVVRVLSDDYTWDAMMDDDGNSPFFCGLNCATEALKLQWKDF